MVMVSLDIRALGNLVALSADKPRKGWMHLQRCRGDADLGYCSSLAAVKALEPRNAAVLHAGKFSFFLGGGAHLVQVLLVLSRGQDLGHGQ